MTTIRFGSFLSRVAAVCAVTGLLVVGAAGCGQTDNDTRSATAGLPDLAQSLGAHGWALADASGTASPLPAGHDLTLRFDDAHTASGQGACNSFGATVTLHGDDGVRFGPVRSTMKSCGSAEDAADHAFFTALERIRSADATDRKELVLTGGGLRLTFHAADPAGRLAGTWKITSVRTPDALESPVADTSPTITFDDGGQVHVTTGCNTIRTSWTASEDGQVVRFAEAAQTMKACTGGDDVEAQERALAAALAATRRVEVAGGRLMLVDDHGDLVLVAVTH